MMGDGSKDPRCSPCSKLRYCCEEMETLTSLGWNDITLFLSDLYVPEIAKYSYAKRNYFSCFQLCIKKWCSLICTAFILVLPCSIWFQITGKFLCKIRCEIKYNNIPKPIKWLVLMTICKKNVASYISHFNLMFSFILHSLCYTATQK